MAKAKSQYYVCGRSLWQGDTWKPIAGPFGSRDAAQKKADELDAPSANAKDAYRTTVKLRTELREWDDADIAQQVMEAEDARRGA